MSADVVIDKIREKSAAEVQAVLDSGEREAAAQTEEILRHAREQAATVIGRAEKKAQAIREGERLQANLERRKQTLAAKRQVLDEAYAAVKERLLSLPDEAWGRFITALVCQSGMNGNAAVYVAQTEEHRLPQVTALCDAWSEQLSRQSGKPCSLTAVGTTGRVGSGVLLCGDRFDVELSFELWIEQLRERTEAETAVRLFEDGNASARE